MAPPKILGDCSVSGCGLAAKGRNFCNIHYQRWYRFGDPVGNPVVRRANLLEMRFLASFKKDGNGCWLWTGAMNTSGYGKVMRGKKHKGAHRVSWERVNGPIPDDLCICHKCDVRRCVNPDHMFLGSIRDNFDDMRAKGRNARGETNGMAKLNEADVKRIRRDKRLNYVIAADYGVSSVLVGKVKRREVWAHV